jgi:hypothetical protein
LDSIQKTPYSFAGYLVFAGLLKAIQGIQGVALYQFREKLAEGMLVAKKLQSYHLSVNCRHRANLAIDQTKDLQVLAQPVSLTGAPLSTLSLIFLSKSCGGFSHRWPRHTPSENKFQDEFV